MSRTAGIPAGERAQTSMKPLPEGTLTFLLTDLEGSTRLWERAPESMPAAIERHETLLTESIEAHGGIVIRTRGEGDSFFSVFSSATGALAAASDLQRALHSEDWAELIALRVRAAVLTGEAHLRDGDYYGADINRCARLRSIGYGGQTLVSESTAGLVRDTLPPGLALRDLGVHRLKDLQRPERVFQLLAEGLPDEFPPLVSLDSLPNNLPQQLTSFIGRDREIREVQDLLASTRLLTLTGTGGAGKTRLALQVAAELLDAYPAGVWLAELGGLGGSELVAHTVASALGVREQPGRLVDESLVDFVKERRLLLVLDNCEHLVDACAALAERLLRSSKDLKILATSRESLNLPGEIAWRVPSLSLPDARRLPRMGEDLPAALTEFESVRLFVDRAVAAQPRFSLSRANAPVVAQICRDLDGIPLALELAAARLRLLSVDQIAARLRDRFRLLTGGSRTALPRQQTLQATIDWSYHLLDDAEKALLRRLAVFAGGWNLEAVEAVVSAGQSDAASVVDVLGHLVDKSLVHAELGPETEPRYRLLEMIRQYALERLDEEGGLDGARSSHRDHFLDLAVRAEEKLQTVEQGAWLDRLDGEIDNLRAALTWSLEGPGGAEPAVRLAVALFRFWYVRGYLSEGRAWLENTLALAAQLSPESRASALNSLGNLVCVQGDYQEANRLLTESLRLWRSSDNARQVAGTLSNLGSVAAQTRDHATARAIYLESLDIYRPLGDRARVANVLSNLGALELDAGDLDAAGPPLEESLAIQRELGDRWCVAVLLQSLGRLAFERGDPERARRLLRECIAVRLQLRDRHYLVVALEAYARVLPPGEYEHAVRLLGAAGAARERMGVPVTPREDQDQRAAAERLRAAVGEAAFGIAWEEGRGWSLDHAARAPGR